MTKTKAVPRRFAGFRTSTGAPSPPSGRETFSGPTDVTLGWAERSFVPGGNGRNARECSVGAGAPGAITVEETIDGVGPDSLATRMGGVRIIRGDVPSTPSPGGWQALGGLRGKVDLVYVDPPYASDRSWALEARLDGPADGRVRRHVAYDDKLGASAYLEMLAPRLDALSALLSPTATIWVHLDWRSAYLVRVVLDEILGRDAFLNEIVWRRAPNLGRQAASQQFGRTLDTILVYGARARNGRGTGLCARPSHPPRADRSAGAIRWEDAEKGGAPVHDRAAGRLHRRPRLSGSRRKDESIARRTGEGLHQVFPRPGRERRLVPGATGRRALDGRAAPPARGGRRAHRLPDPEAARAPRPNHHQFARQSRGAGGGFLFAGSAARRGEIGPRALGRRAILGDAGGCGDRGSLARRLARFLWARRSRSSAAGASNPQRAGW